MSMYSEKGDKRANRVLKLHKNFDGTLTGILVWVNIINMIYETIITVHVAKTYGESATFIAVIISTILISVLGEIVPKVFIANKTDQFILRTSLLLSVMLKIVKPLTYIFSKASLLITKPFIKESKKVNSISEDDLEDLTIEARKDGEIEKDTQELLCHALDLDEKQAYRYMQPWEKVHTISEDNTPLEIYNIIKDIPYSRLPVLNKKNDVVGVLNTSLFLRRYYISGEEANVKNSITRPFFVKKNEKLDEILSLMQENKIHMAIVHSIDNKTSKRTYIGIITVEDILEELVGEIYDEVDEVKSI